MVTSLGFFVTVEGITEFWVPYAEFSGLLTFSLWLYLRSVASAGYLFFDWQTQKNNVQILSIYMMCLNQ